MHLKKHVTNVNIRYFKGTDAEIDQLTVAFSRPRNIRDELISARLHQVEGQEASTFRPVKP